MGPSGPNLNLKSQSLDILLPDLSPSRGRGRTPGQKGQDRETLLGVDVNTPIR